MKNENLNRRSFLKTVTAAGLGSFAAGRSLAKTPDANSADPSEQKKSKMPQIPRRKFGRTGLKIPILSLGGDFNWDDKQIVLQKTLEWGANFWDTAHAYGNGTAEIGIGKFFARNPEKRKNVFLVTKASIFRKTLTTERLEERLQLSLKRLQTNYIDLYYGIHSISDTAQLTDEVRKWAESAKKRKLIRFFGFSTHKNMATYLEYASELDWIDAVMITYNYRITKDTRLLEAIDACHKKGIGLVAMKVMGHKVKQGGEDLIEHFAKQGYTEGQAKIKVALENEKISSACIGMANIGLLMQNAAAVLDKTKLSTANKNILNSYAERTCSGYCAGCAEICDDAIAKVPYVSDIMRHLMYYNSYGDHDRAKAAFAQIPAEIRNRLLSFNYTAAEARCPQRLPIAKLIEEAVTKLA